MDQLKPILAMLKKHFFWIASAVILLLSIFTYRSVSSSIEEQRAKSVSTINSAYSTVKTVKNAGPKFDDATFHPNEETHEGMEQLIAKSKKELKKAWEFKFKTQQDLLFWDEELGQTAINKFKDLMPIEKTVPFAEEAGPAESRMVPARDRFAYRELIVNVLPKLAETIGDAWQPLLKRKQGVTEEQKERVKKAERVVIWDEKNQNYWESRFTDYGSAINSQPDTPRILQVLYAQEDLWILRSVLQDVIKKTNGDAQANDLAKIKKIDHIFIGHDAQGIVGEVQEAKEDMAPQMGMDDSAAREAAMAQAMEMGMGGGGGPGGPSPTAVAKYGDGTADPANGRYVDREFKPLSATVLRESFKTVKKDLAYLAIAKRIPVRIGMHMDERAVMDLLANCANARLPLEVRQVRINVHKAGVTGSLASQFTRYTARSGMTGGGGRGGMMGGPMMEMGPQGGPDMEAMMSGRNMMGGGMNRASMAPKLKTGAEFDVPVEIYGIIFLYNPPDEAMLDVPDAAPTETPAEPPVEPTATLSDSTDAVRS